MIAWSFGKKKKGKKKIVLDRIIADREEILSQELSVYVYYDYLRVSFEYTGSAINSSTLNFTSRSAQTLHVYFYNLEHPFTERHFLRGKF